MASYFQWLKADYGFEDSQVKPYTFNRAAVSRRQEFRHAGLRHFGAFRDREAGEFTPKVFLLADQGFSAYSTLIETRRDLVDK